MAARVYTIGMNAILVLLLLAGPVAAQVVRAPGADVRGSYVMTGDALVFTQNFVTGVKLSLAQDPFFASKLLQSYDIHMAKVSASRSAADAAAYLRSEVLGKENSAPKSVLESLADILVGPKSSAAQGKQLRESLGARPISENQAGALLLANALAAPEQFKAIISRLEASRPGLGNHLASKLKNPIASSNSNYSAIAALRALGSEVEANPTGLTYNSKGVFDTFYDGAQ